MIPIGNAGLGSKEGCDWWMSGVKRRNGGGKEEEGSSRMYCTTFPARSLGHKVQNLGCHRLPRADSLHHQHYNLDKRVRFCPVVYSTLIFSLFQRRLSNPTATGPISLFPPLMI